ncbi:Rv1535 domain-containing protein [uncultured Mycobacterium sp.]|uniref:Rv1535 domain-containing protein n=1 Tax=uncultured Mycobacterium sp. TaxID=171292 RepID=UPI0035CAA7F3
MATTDALADPLVSALGALLTVPLVHLYAVAWRLGVVDVVKTDRSSAEPESTAALAALLADQRQGGSAHRPRRSRRSPNPAPAPTQPDQAAYSQAAG